MADIRAANLYNELHRVPDYKIILRLFSDCYIEKQTMTRHIGFHLRQNNILNEIRGELQGPSRLERRLRYLLKQGIIYVDRNNKGHWRNKDFWIASFGLAIYENFDDLSFYRDIERDRCDKHLRVSYMVLEGMGIDYDSCQELFLAWSSHRGDSIVTKYDVCDRMRLNVTQANKMFRNAQRKKLLMGYSTELHAPYSALIMLHSLISASKDLIDAIKQNGTDVIINIPPNMKPILI